MNNNDYSTPFLDIVNDNHKRVQERQRQEDFERRRNMRINRRRLEQERKMKLQKIKRGVVTVVVGASLLAGIVGYTNAHKFDPVQPQGYETIYTVEQVDYNESLWDIAEYYYDNEVYGQYYRDIRDFIDEIKKVNNLHGNTITPYQNLVIPCFVQENNIYLEQISSLEQRIKELPRHVEYEVKFGDTLLGLAYLGAGDTNEAYEIKQEIQSINGLNSTIIVQGTKLKIVNPEIGNLKKEIAQYQEKLNASLKVNVENNEITK